MGRVAYSLIQVLIFAIAGVLVSTYPAKEDKISASSTTPKGNKDEEIKTWPKVFYLSMDPNDPIVCYKGILFNSSDSESNTTSQKGKNDQQIFTLSEDPRYPVTCRRGSVPVSLADTLLVVEDDNGGNITNVTCIRRDYENNISAIFIYEAGPLHTAWNVFNNTIQYRLNTAKDVNKVDEKKVLKEYTVDCAEYGIYTGDKGLCQGAMASLCG